MLALALMVGLASAPYAGDTVYEDGRDLRSLTLKKLVNRDLDAQLDAWRLGDFDFFRAAFNGLVSTQAPLDGGGMTPYHGFFVADLFLEVEPIEGVTANLNLTMFNRTASGGFRILTDVRPGFAFTVHTPLFELDEAPLFVDFVGPDLDLVTIGQGLMMENIPLEGFITGFRYRDWALRGIFGGRAFWPEDDYLHIALDALDGALGVGFTQWWSGSEDYEVTSFPEARYLSAHGRWSPWLPLTLSAELATRVTSFAPAALARVDYSAELEGVRIHLGYQFRYYAEGFGPRDTLVAPSVVGVLPTHESTYATNAFLFLWASPEMEQWTHAVMAEARYRVERWEFFTELEGWVRVARRNLPDDPVLTAPDGRQVPGEGWSGFYSAGLRFYPVNDLPHFVTLFASNKHVFAPHQGLYDTTAGRFLDRPTLLLEGEVRL